MSKESLGSFKNRFSFNISVANLVKNLVDVGKSVKVGARVATTAAGEGVEATLRSVGIAANAARIGIFAVSVALLPFDIYTMVNSSMALDSARRGNRGTEPEAVKKLRHLANCLELEMNEMLQAVDEFQRTY